MLKYHLRKTQAIWDMRFKKLIKDIQTSKEKDRTQLGYE